MQGEWNSVKDVLPSPLDVPPNPNWSRRVFVRTRRPAEEDFHMANLVYPDRVWTTGAGALENVTHWLDVPPVEE